MKVVICECCGDSNSQMESGRVQARRDRIANTHMLATLLRPDVRLLGWKHGYLLSGFQNIFGSRTEIF